MRIVGFYHSLVSDWNHGNAHFLRGLVRSLRRLGHAVAIYEPSDGWSRENMLADAGPEALAAFEQAFPDLRSEAYGPRLDLDRALDGADLVLVHEWTDPDLVRRIGRHRAAAGCYALLFHDTHHRAVTAPEEIGRYDLDGYDGVLAFGDVLREIYLARGWARRAWTWHEAADASTFHPLANVPVEADLVWVGNWGDDERTAELHEYLIGPAADLHLAADVHGVRYPEAALAQLAAAGIAYRGYLPNHRVPEAFARHRVTVHVPRRPYAEALPGIPTIRVFEALACGIPLVSAPWRDSEGLFRPGLDFLMAPDGAAMRRHLRDVLADRDLAAALATNGRETVLARHTCDHRARELLAIHAEIAGPAQARVPNRELA